MSAMVEVTSNEMQHRFCTGRSTMNATFLVHQVIEKVKEHGVALHLHFIDFKSAFEMVWREAL